MKSPKDQGGAITGPLLKELMEQEKVRGKALPPAPSVGSEPLEQPALYQDAGSGYNSDFVFPQD